MSKVVEWSGRVTMSVAANKWEGNDAMNPKATGQDRGGERTLYRKPIAKLRQEIETGYDKLEGLMEVGTGVRTQERKWVMKRGAMGSERGGKRLVCGFEGVEWRQMGP